MNRKSLPKEVYETPQFESLSVQPSDVLASSPSKGQIEDVEFEDWNN